MKASYIKRKSLTRVMWHIKLGQFWCSSSLDVINFKGRKLIIKKENMWGFPGGAVIENPPANAGDAGSSPGPWGSHILRSNWAREPQLLSLRSRVPETQLPKPARLGPMLRKARGHHNEKPAHRSREWPPLATTRESPRVAAKTQCSQKLNKFIKKKENMWPNQLS